MSEVVEIVVTRYKCGFCGRSWSKKRRATEHADRCWQNPSARSCGSCGHYKVCCSDASAECGCRGVPWCEKGRDVWVTPEGYTDLSVHPRMCSSWEAS